MNTDPYGLYPARSIMLGARPGMESSLPRLKADQIEAVRAVVVQWAVDGHHTAPIDRYGSGFADLVAVVTIGWDGIGNNQLLLVVTQGHGGRDSSTLDLTVMPYAAPPIDDGPSDAFSTQTPKSFRPDSAAELLDEVVTTIKAIDGLVPPKPQQRER